MSDVENREIKEIEGQIRTLNPLTEAEEYRQLLMMRKEWLVQRSMDAQAAKDELDLEKKRIELEQKENKAKLNEVLLEMDKVSLEYEKSKFEEERVSFEKTKRSFDWRNIDPNVVIKAVCTLAGMVAIMRFEAKGHLFTGFATKLLPKL